MVNGSHGHGTRRGRGLLESVIDSAGRLEAQVISQEPKCLIDNLWEVAGSGHTLGVAGWLYDLGILISICSSVKWTGDYLHEAGGRVVCACEGGHSRNL